MFDWGGVFQADGQRKAAQRTLGDLVAGLPDLAINFHGRSVVAVFGPVGDGHLDEKFIGAEHLVDELLPLLALLGEGRKFRRGGFGEDGISSQFGVEFVT